MAAGGGSSACHSAPKPSAQDNVSHGQVLALTEAVLTGD